MYKRCLYACIFAFLLCLQVGEGLCENDKLDKIEIYSVKSKKVNMRAGPGKQYKAGKVISCINYPLQVLDEFEEWKKVIDFKGNTGWVNSAMLKISDHSIVSKGYEKLYGFSFDYDIPHDSMIVVRLPNVTSRPIAILRTGVRVRVSRCINKWCQVSFTNNMKRKMSGWMPQESLWLPLPKKR